MRRGRSMGRESPPGRMTTQGAGRGFLAALGALLLAACPQLETPVATVSGRIVGASAGAYAYPFGRPDLKVATALDGSFRIEGVPTSVPSIVLFDGADRAERVPVELEGGGDNRLADRFGAASGAAEPQRMPLAATVLAAAIPAGGGAASGASYAVVGTDHAGVLQGTGESAVSIGPLPAGPLDIRAALPGYEEGGAPVLAIAGGTVAIAIALPIDADAGEPGCVAGSGCLNGLACGDDGRCYACTDTAGCGGGESCDTASGLCRPDTGPASQVCGACSGDAGCDAGLGLYCVVKPTETTGYCTRACTAPSECPAGFDCSSGRCVAPEGCDDWLQTMGAPCVDSGQCASHLYQGQCATPAGPPGHCTAACTTDGDCRIGTGTAATMLCTGGWCTLP